MADARNVRGHFDSVGEAHARHFPQRRIRLLGSRGVHTGAHTALLRAAFQGRTRRLPPWRLPPITHKLIKRWHEFPLREDLNYVEQPYGEQPTTAKVRNTAEPRISKNGRNCEDYQNASYLTGPCRNRSDRTSLGASSPAGPAHRRVVAQEQKASSRETPKY